MKLAPVTVALLSISQTAAVQSGGFVFSSTAFVSPASPKCTGTTSSTCTIDTDTNKFQPARIISGVSPNSISSRTAPLFAKKKKKDATVGKGGKIQVKLLNHLAGTGQAGEVIMVAPAFFQNKLQKSGIAIRISDEEVAKEQSEKAVEDKEELDAATSLKEKIEGMELNLPKKAGPDGQLFGGIGNKHILSEMKSGFPKGALNAKHIKITSIKDDEGKKLKHDIKHVGEYTSSISLLKGVSADFKISVTAE